jgi:toxin ParE1/3/4
VIYRVVYTDAARIDLREIAAYFRNAAGDVVAEATASKITYKIETLGVRPARQRLRKELGSGLRAVPVGNYLIFYRVEAGTVSIVRILHGSRNISEKLFS